MSLYADILNDVGHTYSGDEDVKFDEATNTWTVVCWEIDGHNLPGIPDKEMALAIVRAIRVGYEKGVDAARYNS